jgi:GTPase
MIAQEELLLPEEPDEGNTEYKLKFDSPTMARIQHLTTQMVYRLNEGQGLAFYQIGVLDSGQVTGLEDEEIFQTLLILFYMSTTLKPRSILSIEKVRLGDVGFSVMLRCTRSEVTSNKNFTGELMSMLATEKVRRESMQEEEEEETKELTVGINNAEANESSPNRNLKP